MCKPDISIIIPAKNEEQNIVQCLDALCNLGYPQKDMEIILVDNGSSDGTIEKARNYDVKIIQIPDVTISKLRNVGATSSTGNLIAFVDADVLVTKDWLCSALKILSDDPEISCLGGFIGIPKQNTWIERNWHLVFQALPRETSVDWVSSMNMFIKRDIFFRIGGFNEGLSTGEDVDFCYRLKKFGKVYFTDQAEVIHIGEAKTIRHFFRKERWRGRTIFSGLLSHGLQWNELPSIIFPVYYIYFYVTIVPILMLMANVYIVLMHVAIFFAIPTLRAFIICTKLRRFSVIFALSFLWWLYYTARAFSVLNFKKTR